MNEIVSKQNLIAAGGVTLAIFVVLNMTAGKGKVVQGALAVGAAAVALHLVKKYA